MSESEIQIPNDIDDRLYVVLEKEEFMAALGGLIAGIMIYNLFLGLFFAWLGYRMMVRFKSRQPRGAIRHWLYWIGATPIKRFRLQNGLEREVFGK